MKKRVSVKIFFMVLWISVCQTVRAFGKLPSVKNGWGYTRVAARPPLQFYYVIDDKTSILEGD